MSAQDSNFFLTCIKTREKKNDMEKFKNLKDSQKTALSRENTVNLLQEKKSISKYSKKYQKV